MTIAFKSNASVRTFATNTDTTISPSLPASHALGDFMLAVVVLSISVGTIGANTPSGWTLVDGRLYNSSVYVGVFYKVHGVSESAPVFTLTGGPTAGCAVVLTYTGASGVEVVASQGQTSTSADAPSVTTAQSSGVRLYVGGVHQNTGVTMSSAPTGFTIRSNQNGTSTITTEVKIAEKTFSSAGALGAITAPFGSTFGAQDNVGMQLVLSSNTASTPVLSSPADGATSQSTSPTLSADETNTAASGTTTVTFDISTDSTFATGVTSHTTASQSNPLSADSFSWAGPTLSSGTTYYWRAKATDSVAGDTSYSSTFSFTTASLPTAPVVQGMVNTTVLPGDQDVQWTYEGALTQTAYAIRRSSDGGATYEYYDAGTDTWGATEVENTDTASLISTPSWTAQTDVWKYSVKTWNANGEGPYAVDASVTVHDAPTVSDVSPSATVTTGGPNMTVTWTYGQAQGVAQNNYRVQVKNAAEDTTYYDSGTFNGTAGSKLIKVTEVGIPTDGADDTLHLIITVTSADGFATVSTTSFAIQWGVVTVAVTSPTDASVVTTPTLTATWSFSSTRGQTQLSFRVRLLQGTGVPYDSGFVVGSGTSHTPDYLLEDGSHYTLEVTCKNTMGVVSS